SLQTTLKNKDSLLSFQSQHGTAKQRIQNQLSYKLGQTMIINSKNIFGILFMPVYIISTLLSHKQEQKIYQEKIKKDPSLKLPPLESYPDYKEALKEKECLTYKLGESLIKANKTWYKGGYVKLWFEIRKLQGS
ncbi:alpha-2,3-sialyltransferase, partial [Campylobacter coli]|nr:alpha-2,3-sialyltransferase [Campylobacter coli]